jgi:hypothetical protein
MTTTAIPTNVSCPHCGASNPAGAAFCESCGKALPTMGATGPRVVSSDAAPATSVARGLLEDDLKKQMKKASTALLIVAILQAVFGPVALMLMKSKAEQEAGPGAVMEIEPIMYVIVFGLAIAFFALWLWSRVNPFAAAIVGLVLFVSVHLLDAVADPTQLARGILVKIIVIAMLVQAIKAGLQYRKLREQQAAGFPVA